MPNRDALWVLPNGVTTVVTVDEHGERVLAAVPEVAAADAEIPATEPAKPTRKRRKR